MLAKSANKPLFNPSDKYCLPPFIPVVPRTQLGLDTLMGMVRHEGRAGVVGLYPSKIIETKPSASEPYYVFDPKIVDGPNSELDRRWSNLDEIIAGLISTPALLTEEKRAILCKTAHYETEKQKLVIAVPPSSPIPTLGFFEINELDPSYGTFYFYFSS